MWEESWSAGEAEVTDLLEWVFHAQVHVSSVLGQHGGGGGLPPRVGAVCGVPHGTNSLNRHTAGDTPVPVAGAAEASQGAVVTWRKAPHRPGLVSGVEVGLHPGHHWVLLTAKGGQI